MEVAAISAAADVGCEVVKQLLKTIFVFFLGDYLCLRFVGFLELLFSCMQAIIIHRIFMLNILNLSCKDLLCLFK